MNEYEIEFNGIERLASLYLTNYRGEWDSDIIAINDVEDAYKLLSVLVEFIRLRETKG